MKGGKGVHLICTENNLREVLLSREGVVLRFT